MHRFATYSFKVISRRVAALGCLFALVAALIVAAPITADAATGYKLTAGGTRTTPHDKAAKITVSFSHNGKAVTSATASLQYRSGNTWRTEKHVKITKGKGSTTVKHSIGIRTYRFTVGSTASSSFKVVFAPTTFSVRGSGAGHGVGMSQYGAYQLARSGKSATSILKYYYKGATVSSVNNNSRTVKVQVLGGATTTTLKFTAGFTLRIGDASAKVAHPYASAGTAVLTHSGSTVTAVVALANGSQKQKFSWTRLTFTRTGKEMQIPSTKGRYNYGNLQATVISGKLNVVNEVKLNTEYLYGVDEMPSSWGLDSSKGMAALQAQAIVARTYVIAAALRLDDTKKYPKRVDPACDCVVYGSTRSQNYTGAAKATGAANAPWIRAVNATKTATTVKVVADPNNPGSLAETPFFASSGFASTAGTANSENVWGNKISYLRSVADPYSAKAPGNPYRTWTTSLTQAKMQKAFATKDTIMSATVTEHYAGGLLRSVRYTTSSGRTTTLTLTTEKWRALLGTKAAWISSISRS